MEYTHLGYDYLDKVDAFTRHSGVDLNYGKPDDDLGRGIYAMARGEVVFAKDTGKGWGKLIVMYHGAYGVWSRYGPLNEIFVREGERLEEGAQLGTCGRSGGNWSPHLHWDLVVKQLSAWTQYTRFWSAENIRSYYRNPLQYLAEQNKLDKKEEPIVTWHKSNKIIEKWSNPPTPDEIKLGYAIYKGLLALSNGKIKFDLKE